MNIFSVLTLYVIINLLPQSCFIVLQLDILYYKTLYIIDPVGTFGLQVRFLVHTDILFFPLKNLIWLKILGSVILFKRSQFLTLLFYFNVNFITVLSHIILFPRDFIFKNYFKNAWIVLFAHWNLGHWSELQM